METKTYIVEISAVAGDDTRISLESEGAPVDSLYAIVAIAERGACVVDTCYRSVSEASAACPDAICPKPYHLSESAIRANHTIDRRRT